MIQYQIDKSKISPEQKRLEEIAKKAPKIKVWREKLREQIGLLKEDYMTKDEDTATGRKMYIDSLIGSIEDAGQRCSEEKLMYHKAGVTYEYKKVKPKGLDKNIHN